MHAKTIQTDIDFDGKKNAVVSFKVDDLEQDFINISLPFDISLSRTQISLIGLITSIVLGKLCLAEEIIIKFPISSEMVNSGLPLLELLYDARCYRDQVDLRPLPRIKLNNELPYLAPISQKKNLDQLHAQLLWSGGKDSTLSYLLLQANGYKVSGYHATINAATEFEELKSIKHLGEMFAQKLELINISSQPFARLGTFYSPTFGKYPRFNSIPQGRDFILFTIMSFISGSKDSNIICSGSEYELYSKVIIYQGKPIYRHDAQSKMGYELITEFLSRWHTRGFKIFSPVAPLTEFRSFKILSAISPKSFNYLSSCFWDSWCGQCLKCFRYSLIQETLGKDLIKFKEDPFKTNGFFDFYLNEKDNPNLTYREEIYYCLNALSERKDIVKKYSVLERYEKELYPQFNKNSAQYIDYILNTHVVESLPEMFKPDLLG